jgi:hypothetical protein
MGACSTPGPPAKPGYGLGYELGALFPDFRGEL